MQLLKARIEELENEVKMLRQEAKNKGEVRIALATVSDYLSRAPALSESLHRVPATADP